MISQQRINDAIDEIRADGAALNEIGDAVVEFMARTISREEFWEAYNRYRSQKYGRLGRYDDY